MMKFARLFLVACVIVGLAIIFLYLAVVRDAHIYEVSEITAELPAETLWGNDAVYVKISINTVGDSFQPKESRAENISNMSTTISLQNNASYSAV